jgi:hypothetical protein
LDAIRSFLERLPAYAGIGSMFFDHDTVNYSEGEFVRDGVTTNSVESVFAVLNRGLIGVYHQEALL